MPGFFPAGSQQSLNKHKETVGELDNNPVSKAIARHLGIDISPEGRAARNRRGIAIIIHGAPLTGKWLFLDNQGVCGVTQLPAPSRAL